MAQIIDIPIFSDERGGLAVIESHCPFVIKRVFHIHAVPENEVRGKHGHIKNRMFFTCASGSCSIYSNNGNKKEYFSLKSPNQGLIVEPEDWHHLSEFSNDCILLVLCSEEYDNKDYFFEEPND